mgnify:CR=1 FL=1
MTTQTEQQLEDALIAQLETLGWDRVTIKDEADLVSNLKHQLEVHNKTSLSEAEFKQVLNKLARGNIFEKAKALRDRVDAAITTLKENGTLTEISQKWFGTDITQ